MIELLAFTLAATWLVVLLSLCSLQKGKREIGIYIWGFALFGVISITLLLAVLKSR